MGNRMPVSSQNYKKVRKKDEKKEKLEVGGHQPRSFEHDDCSNESDDGEGVLEIEDINENQEVTVIGRKECPKKKLHEKLYKPFESLTMTDLPEQLRHPAIFDYIYARGKMVVKIILQEKSRANPTYDSMIHCASGYACIGEDEIVEETCPLQDCQITPEQDHKVYGGILVTTNKHVIYDEFEAKRSEFYFYYESASTTDPGPVGHGYALRENTENKDYVGAKIFVHSVDVIEQIKQYSSKALVAWHDIPYDLQVEFQKHAVAISHPHGMLKQVSFGNLEYKEKLNEKKGCLVSQYTCLTCKGSSGSPVLSGFYWNNPFVHSRGFRTKDKVWGQSFFY